MLAKHPLLLALYLLTFLIVGAYFATYSYIELFVAKFNPAGDHLVTYVLLAFGTLSVGGRALLGHQVATKFGLEHIGEARDTGCTGACKLPLRKREICGEK